MRVLIVTRRLEDFAGSEIVAWEVADYFAAQGDAVTLAATTFGEPVASLPRSFDVTTELASLDLSLFDLVWSQHHMVLHVPYGIETSIRRKRFPFVVHVTLSPYVPAEHIDGALVRALGSEVWANSRESAERIADTSRNVVPRRAIHVFNNASPASFVQPGSQPGKELKRVLVVSNHVPAELEEAIEQLRARGIEVDVVGAAHRIARVSAADVALADAVVSIGKTVVNAIVMNRPVFVYDRFGGPGWLSPATVVRDQAFNFSGRPDGRKLTADVIVQLLVDGYADAAASTSVIRALCPDLELDNHLAELRRRAQTHRGRVRAARAGAHFLSRSFRSHVASLRALTAGLL